MRGVPVGDSAAVEIRASTVLPARRRDIVLRTADGLDLLGELALPPRTDPVATLICLHPLPTAGGMMDSHVLRKASYRRCAARRRTGQHPVPAAGLRCWRP